MKNNDLITLRIGDILHSIYKHKILIGALTLVGLIIGILLSMISYMRGEMTKEYAITSSFAVTSITEDGLFSTQSTNPSGADIYLAESMVDSVIYVIRSDRTLNAAIDYLGLIGVTSREISANLTLKQYNDTQIVEMTLYWRSAEEGVQILNAINKVSPAILIDTLKIGGLSVVNDPNAKYLIGGSVNASMWLYMAALGFVLGCGLSVVGLILKPTIVNTKDAETKLGLEVLGVIEYDKAYFNRKHIAADSVDSGTENGGVGESFSSAAHILLSALGKKEHKCIYVTSATGNEGRTGVAANLAVRLADLEKKVLLIDFDAHNPSLGTLFVDKVEYSRSLNALYRGDAEQIDAIIPLTGYLDLLPAILEPRALPLDEAMLSMVKELSKNYDFVIMDTTPVGQVSETMNLNRIADAALFVIRYDQAGIEEIQNALEKMNKTGVHIVGCLINAVKKTNNIKVLGEKGRLLKGKDGNKRVSAENLVSIAASSLSKKREKNTEKAEETPVDGLAEDVSESLDND